MDVEKIAKSLSKAARETFLENRKCVASYKPAQKLVELGLWERGDEYTIQAVCTSLGLAVREYLEKSDGR